MTSVVAATAKRSVWSKVTSVPAKYPFAFGVIFSGFKTSFSDLLVQKVVERREEVDWKRNAAFAAFGFFYLGGVQYAIYVPFFSRLFPGAASFAAKPIREKIKDARGIFNLGAQVFLDQCVHHPLMYFPAFYCTRELVMSEKPDVRKALASYQANMSEDLAALWKVWLPATAINFAFMPMYARIPFVAGVSLLWTCILSTMRGGDVAHGEDMAGGAVTGATLTIMKEGIDTFFTKPLELDRDMSHIVITASGHDKVRRLIRLGIDCMACLSQPLFCFRTAAWMGRHAFACRRQQWWKCNPLENGTTGSRIYHPNARVCAAYRTQEFGQEFEKGPRIKTSATAMQYHFPTSHWNLRRSGNGLSRAMCGC